jgi:hypothetical protein
MAGAYPSGAPSEPYLQKWAHDLTRKYQTLSGNYHGTEKITAVKSL